MISANISNAERRAIYERDGFRCALCDSTRFLQIHHHIPRGEGGTNSPHNLITLCADCHAMAHGTNLRDWQDVTQEDIQQACCEYLADMYAPGWNPWSKHPYPCPDCTHKRFCDAERLGFCPLDVTEEQFATDVMHRSDARQVARMLAEFGAEVYGENEPEDGPP